MENAVLKQDKIELVCDFDGFKKKYKTTTNLQLHISMVHDPAPQLTLMRMTTLLEETKIVIMKKAEKGIYDVEEVGKATMDNVTFNTDHLLHAVNSSLKNIRTLVEVKLHMMVSLKSCIRWREEGHRVIIRRG